MKALPMSYTNSDNIIILKDHIQNPDITVGDYTYYARENETDDFFSDNILYYRKNHGKLNIGKFCSIAHGTQFIMSAANHSTSSFSTYPFNIVEDDWKDKLGMTLADMPHRGDTVIGSDVWIGRDATIMSGVHISDGAVIGAKAVVAKDVPPYAIVVGNPAKIIKYRFDQDTIDFLLRLQWWDFSKEQLDEAIPFLTSVDLATSREALENIKMAQ